MTAASATPQQMRDRLLQAIDGQSNQIHNMVAVMEVISHLEKYPITKEALEETRLGKLINDVRKKTKDEDLAKRAKKLLRNWQKLIEPGQTEVQPKASAGKTEKSGGRKRKGGQRDGLHTKKLAHEPAHNSSPPSTNGVGGSPESLPSPLDTSLHPPSDRGRSEHLDNDKHGKIPVNAVKPHPSSPGLPLIAPAQASRTEGPPPLEPKSSLSWRGLDEDAVHLQHSTGLPELPRDSLHSPKSTSHTSCTPPLGQAFSSEVARVEADGVNSCFEGKRRKRYRPRDYTVNLVGQPTEESTKPVRLKDRRLTFDPVTGQIKPLTHKESCQGEEPLGPPPPKIQRTDLLPQNPSAPLPSPFQQTNWKDLYRNEIIQSYLNIQSNVLTSSGAQTPGAHFFMTEYLKREEHCVKESRKTHVLVADSSDTDMPGVSREVTPEDLNRIHKEHWPGVNGCYDTKGNWYDWTQCISLDPHGDESKLNILPYVCLD
ncbi:hypothetical protein ANANG_G00086820 [Anguilla anguilla]|uniref:Mediator of RNA polymerase II transcription subunit 26 n=1 Tax=Anguilla anguilla TaxID=7936 RepID=A0A9D3ML34_ANGAN|nr:hypothetical protein ANANG_G00086820 [Anguilla anguilla]